MNMVDQERITEEFLVSQGFKFDKIFGYIKKVGDTDLLVGSWPYNSMCLSIMHNGHTIVTKELSRDSILTAIKLLDDCVVDEP